MNEDLDFRWMHGLHITEVSETEGIHWRFILDGGGSITTECLWRLIRDGRIAITSEDHGQRFGLPEPVDAVSFVTSLLANASIQRVEFRDGTADLAIHFGGDLCLEFITTSSGFESWQITAHDGSGGGGVSGGLVRFSANREPSR